MKVLLLNQAFYPDVASTAQHASDLAARLVECGHQVTAVASRRAYDQPERLFPAREVWRGVEIIRISASGFGKKAKWRRALDFGTFLMTCLLQVLRLPRFDAIVALTSPPLISFLAALVVGLRGGRLVFWVMDLNPDEAIAAGWLSENSAIAKSLESMLRFSLRRSSKIVVLDRFMAGRIRDKGMPEEKIQILPPWSHDDAVQYDPEGRRAFRQEHGLEGKYVVMYSGNHSPCHPLDTLLRAALRLSSEREIHFCFLGGGSEFRKVKEFASRHALENITCLPYQPLRKLSASLSSADLHAVVMGNAFVGIVHPCKIYNILTLGLPVLYIGPAPSHITDLAPETAYGKWMHPAAHGDVDAVVEHILKNRGSQRSRWLEQTHAARFAQFTLVNRMVRAIEADVVPLLVAEGQPALTKEVS
jgi:colanic acid biosynthesis glycosyl transferase WcaI